MSKPGAPIFSPFSKCSKRLSEKEQMSAAKEGFFRRGRTWELVNTNDQGVTKPEGKCLAARQGSLFTFATLPPLFQFPKPKHSFGLFQMVSKASLRDSDFDQATSDDSSSGYK